MHIYESQPDQQTFNSIADILDFMASAYYEGAEGFILYEEQLPAAFFDLRTGFAGEMLQKFANYHLKLAIVGEFEKYDSKSFQAFIRECNRGKQVFFCPDRESALDQLLNK